MENMNLTAGKFQQSKFCNLTAEMNLSSFISKFSSLLLCHT